MNAAAALLADRTDCGEFSPLNFDALLLGGYFCHPCLPDPCAEGGGTCKNVWWKGHTCSTTHYVELGAGNSLTIGTVSAAIFSGGDTDGSSRVATETSRVKLGSGKEYKFVINSPGAPVFLVDKATGNRYTDGVTGQGSAGVEHGVIRLQVSESMPQLAFACANAAVSAGGTLVVDDGADSGTDSEAAGGTNLAVAVAVPVVVVLLGGVVAAVLVRRATRREFEKQSTAGTNSVVLADPRSLRPEVPVSLPPVNSFLSTVDDV